MADDRRPAPPSGFEFARSLTARRNVLLTLGVLLSIAIVCAVAINLMLQRIELRDAHFHPPMTPSEREQLMPVEPRLDVAPSVDGLRYGGDRVISDGSGESSAARLPDEKTLSGQPVKEAYAKSVNKHAQAVSHAP